MRGAFSRLGVAALAATSMQTFAAPAGSPVDKHGALRVAEATVNGATMKTVVNQAGVPTQLAGMSLFWSGWAGQFYNRKAVSYLAYDWNISVIRAAIGVDGGGNYLDTANNNAAAGINILRADSVIQTAIDNGIYVIIDWHDHYAHNHTARSVEFFQRMATKWGKYPNVIYEIFNEPMGAQAATTTKPAVKAITWKQIEGYSDTVIAAIRAIDSTNLILVGNPSWDQKPTAASNSILNTKYTNLAYTLHFYSGTHDENLRSEGERAMVGGLALFLSEWGTSNADGGGGEDKAVYKDESKAWLDWAKTFNLSWCNWSVVNKTESSAAFLPTAGSKGWWPDSLISESGLWVRDQIRLVNKPFNYVIPDPPPADKPDTANLPGRMQAEGFVAMSGIQSESGADIDGSDDIGYIDDGDWADYVVNVVTPGKYYFHARVASAGTGGPLSLLSATGDTLAKVSAPVTGGWQKWTTVIDSSSLVELPAGLVRLRLSFGGRFNVNWIELKSVVDGVIQPRRGATPWRFSGNVLTLEGLDRTWNRVVVRDIRGQIVAQSPLREGGAQLQLAGKGIFFAEVSGTKGRETRKIMVGE